MPGKQTILFLGNSLPLEGIDIPQLRTSLGHRAVCIPFFIEQTQYLDWYFGMRRLFEEGSKPDIVVVSMSIPHLMSSLIRGDYSSFYLFRTADFPEIKRDTHSNLTTMSGLLLAHYSLFYAGRTPLRNFLLNKIDPSYGNFLHGLSTRPALYTNPGAADDILTKRLQELRELSNAEGVRFVFLLPPGFGPNESTLVVSGKQAGAQVIVPIDLNAFDRDKFRDGFHLNKAGSIIFTRQLSYLLGQYLDTLPSE